MKSETGSGALLRDGEREIDNPTGDAFPGGDEPGAAVARPAAPSRRPGAPDCVFTAAYGVGPDYVRTFLRTFRAVNTTARVILLVWNREPLKDIAREYGADLDQDRWFCRHVPRITVRYTQFGGNIANKKLRVTELLGRSTSLAPRLGTVLPEVLTRSLVSLAVSRFFHIRDILEREDFGQVLLADSRDVFFQDDPFATPAELDLAEETFRFGSEPFNDVWVSDGFGPETLKAMEGRHTFCSGTILGSRKAVLEHVSRMCDHTKRLRTWRYGGIDQAIHNYVIWKYVDTQACDISTERRGRLATVYQGMDARIRDGLLVDEDGKPFPVVHQYDRLDPAILSTLRMLRTDPSAQ